MGNVFWIYFHWRNDLVGGRVEGKSAKVYWNDKQMPDRELSREYSAEEFRNLHPMQVREAVFQTAGFEAMHIRDITIHPGDLDWNELLKQRGVTNEQVG